MPLSEDEQRILSEIEDGLYQTDPQLASEIAETTVYTAAFRALKWATFFFVVSVGFLIFALSTSYLLSFVGFLGMLASALWFERNARRLGRVGLEQMTQRMRGGGFRDVFGDSAQRMRDRFNRTDDES